MRSFCLIDPEFAGLAAGRPSAETLGNLRKAQLSRHLLQLRATGTVPIWYGGSRTHDRLADPMTAVHTAATLAARRTGTAPPPEQVLSARRLTAQHDGLTLRVRLEDTDPLRTRLGLAPTGRLTDAEVAGWQHCLDPAWRLLVERHRTAAETLAAVLSVIVPVEPDPGAGGISATSAEAYGAVAISAPTDPAAFAVGLVHEVQHSLLNATRFLFDLVEPSGERGYSPWRDDPRPPFGILHGAYAYQAVTRFWRREAREARAAGGPGVAAFEFARWRAAVVAATDELLAAGRLTAAGRRFTGALRDEVAGWLTEPVDPEVARLAAGANIEHRVRWQLRNVAVDPDTVAAVVAARRAGAPAPALPAPVIRPAGRRVLEHSDRLAGVHRLLRERTRLDAYGNGDDAYLQGDHEAARTAYQNDLDLGVLDGARQWHAWSGIALVSPEPALRERPEIVRAVWFALAKPDVRALAAWLSGEPS